MSGSWLRAITRVFFWAAAGSAASMRARGRASRAVIVVNASRLSIGAASMIPGLAVRFLRSKAPHHTWVGASRNRSTLGAPRELLEAPNLAGRRLEAALGRPGDLGHVDGPLGIGDHAVGGRELAGLLAAEWPAEACDLLTLGVQHRHAWPEIGHVLIHGQSVAELADVEGAAVLGAVHEEAAGAVEIVPLALVPALAVEDLDAMILAVRHIDEPVAIGDEVVGQVEVSRVGAGLTPGHDVLAVGRVLVHARVAVAVRDEEIAALRADGHVSRTVEGLAPLKRRGLVGVSDGQEQLTLRRELPHGVLEIVGEPHGSVGIDGDAVGAPHVSLAPGANELAVAVEDDDGMLAPREAEDIVLGVHGYARDLHEVPAVRELAPAIDRLEYHLSPRLGALVPAAARPPLISKVIPQRPGPCARSGGAEARGLP